MGRVRRKERQRERDNEREREKETETEREREKEIMREMGDTGREGEMIVIDRDKKRKLFICKFMNIINGIPM